MKKSIIFVLLFSFFFLSISILLPINTKGNIEIQNAMKSVDIDGNIEGGEWNDADWYNVPFYLDVNNTEGDKDGMNYISIGEDQDNIYISLDMCSDQTEYTDEEWLGLWLDTNKTYFENIEDWEGLLNNGAEDLLYDAKNGQELPMFLDDLKTTFHYLDSSDSIHTTFGIQEGDYTDLFSDSSGTFSLTSTNESDPSKQEFVCNFVVNMSTWSVFWNEYKDEINSMNLEISTNINTTEIDDLRTVIGEKAYPIYPYDGGFLFNATTIPIGLGNITEDNLLPFSIYGSNSSSSGQFKLSIGSVKFRINVSSWNRPTDSIYSHTSLNNYEIKKGFHSSANCDEKHRMFEISIPKTELELYDANNSLGIFIAGQGTVSLENDGAWHLGASGSDLFPYSDNSYIYFEMMGDATPSEKSIWDVILENLIIIGSAIISIIFGILGIAIIRKRKKRLDDISFDSMNPDYYEK
jgi:hypothetical protein